jgi:3-dehydroquinate synthase
LNLGHTIGHAIEFLSEYNVSHGYAVAIGICYESCLSYKKGNISFKDYEDIQQFILQFYKPLTLKESDITALTNYCFDDKKNKNEIVRFVFLEEIGKADF